MEIEDAVDSGVLAVVEEVRARTAAFGVVAAVAGDEVVPGPARDAVVTLTAAHLIVPVPAVERDARPAGEPAAEVGDAP